MVEGLPQYQIYHEGIRTPGGLFIAVPATYTFIGSPSSTSSTRSNYVLLDTRAQGHASGFALEELAERRRTSQEALSVSYSHWGPQQRRTERHEERLGVDEDRSEPTCAWTMPAFWSSRNPATLVAPRTMP